MEKDGTKGERRQRKRDKKKEMRKSGRSFIVSVRSAIEKRLKEQKDKDEGKGA